MEDEGKLLLSKHYTCPSCEFKFISKAVKTGSARFVRTEFDLRPIYQNLEVLKYDTVVCPQCGYAALERYFGELSDNQAHRIHARISSNYNPRPFDDDYYTYDIALERYKLCLLSTMVKETLESEIGYVCLKLSWLLQAKAEWHQENTPDNQAAEACLSEEKLYSQKALEHLEKARMEEDYPVCGMDEPTLDYLLAALAYKADRFDYAVKILGSVSTSKEATDRLKDKAYELKALISAKVHAT